MTSKACCSDFQCLLLVRVQGQVSKRGLVCLSLSWASFFPQPHELDVMVKDSGTPSQNGPSHRLQFCILKCHRFKKLCKMYIHHPTPLLQYCMLWDNILVYVDSSMKLYHIYSFTNCHHTRYRELFCYHTLTSRCPFVTTPHLELCQSLIFLFTHL